MPRPAAFGDQKALGGNNKREAKQLLKENKVKEVQLRKYPRDQPSKSKYLIFYEGTRSLLSFAEIFLQKFPGDSLRINFNFTFKLGSSQRENNLSDYGKSKRQTHVSFDDDEEYIPTHEDVDEST